MSGHTKLLTHEGKTFNHSTRSNNNDGRRRGTSSVTRKVYLVYTLIPLSLLLIIINTRSIHNIGNTIIDPRTIAYVVTITSCTDPHTNQTNHRFADAAAVLKHSIHTNSLRNPHSGSRYDYKMYAFVHPSAAACHRRHLKLDSRLGYAVLERDDPVDVSTINGEFLRTNVDKVGCCGSKEFLKLYSYTLTNHAVVVHLDLDYTLFRPLDELFDAMLLDGGGIWNSRAAAAAAAARRQLIVSDGTFLPRVINAYFTRDYAMSSPGKRAGVQGGFLVVRPDVRVFREFQKLIREGNFVPGRGWNGKYGGFYGAQQIQGLVSYYYDGLHPKTAVELDLCTYNNMAQDLREKESGECRGRNDDNCKNCMDHDLSKLKGGHFTECFKPWWCRPDAKRPLCLQMHAEWFRLRKEFEMSGGGAAAATTNMNEIMSPILNNNTDDDDDGIMTNGTSSLSSQCTGNWNEDVNHGCCKIESGRLFYIPIFDDVDDDDL